MKIIEAVIERAKDGTFSVYCMNEIFTGMGNTAEAAKMDMRQQMDFFKKTAIEDNFPYPDFLNEDFEIVYKFDTESLLEYYSGILSLSGLEKITGIHQKQLWNYLHRKSKPRKAQVEKIEKGLHTLGSELISISL
jgi:predicted RNase H-like HicB family nuclease